MTGQATVPPPAPAEAAPSEEEATGRLARLARLQAQGPITHRFPLDGYAGALDALRGDRTVHKIIIECWQQ